MALRYSTVIVRAQDTPAGMTEYGRCIAASVSTTFRIVRVTATEIRTLNHQASYVSQRLTSNQQRQLSHQERTLVALEESLLLVERQRVYLKPPTLLRKRFEAEAASFLIEVDKVPETRV